jgi:hypothetical protein
MPSDKINQVMSIVNVSTAKPAAKAGVDLSPIVQHNALLRETSSKIRQIEWKQLEVFRSADAEAMCKTLRKIASLEWSVVHLSKVAEITRHAAAGYCTIAKALQGECKGRTAGLIGLVLEFEESNPSSLTFHAFAAWLRKGKENGPKPDKVSASIGGLIFTLKEGAAKPPKEYTPADLQKAIKLLDKLSNKLKELQ